MKRFLAVLASSLMAVGLAPLLSDVPSGERGASAAGLGEAIAAPAVASRGQAKVDSVPLSGTAEFRGMNAGSAITECPQAGVAAGEPRPLDKRRVDAVERISNRGDDVRANPDLSCLPHNETSIDTNPTHARNIVGGSNDYRLGFGSSGFFASTNGGRSWYSGIQPFPSLPTGDNLDGGGDPVIVFDREGVVYYAEINFNRTDDTNGVFVMRSTNGGFTWTRACVPIDVTPRKPNDNQAVCGATGDPRQPGDGTVSFNQDPDAVLDFDVAFDDKEYMAAGPRPQGVPPRCFTPITGSARRCDPDVVGSDRLYVTWTRFAPEGRFGVTANIYLSYSDDQARSWSEPEVISGTAPFCARFTSSPKACDLNQFSVPTVHPKTGHLGVAFENFNTPGENQYLFVRSRDGGATFQGPFYVTPVFDVNFPVSGAPPAGNRPDCAARGQSDGRIVYTNSCFRSNAGGNVVFDDRGGRFADDLYLVMSDNRNGSPASSNADVFLFKSNNGGSSWIGPSRINNDRSRLTGGRDDAENTGKFGNDQWWPWADISPRGDLNVVFHDRRLDRSSKRIEWPTSRSRPGNYLVWNWGAQCRVTEPDSRQCLSPDARVIRQPDGAVNVGPGPVPGQGRSYVGGLRNFQVSDVPSNFDYAFRAGIFAGDYNNVAVADNAGGRAHALWTDARNGRSSGGPAGGGQIPSQPGRNPACEQSDVFYDSYSARDAGRGGQPLPRAEQRLFLVTPCPSRAVDDRQGREFRGFGS